MIDPDVPSLAEIHGFRIKPTGTHLSRTMMLEDLRAVLSACANRRMLSKLMRTR